MMHLAPNLGTAVEGSWLTGKRRNSGSQDFAKVGAWAPREWTKVTEDTGVGNPAAATAEKGKKFFEAVTDRVSGFLVDLASADVAKMYE
jgi:creatinine amidohydrolase